jgi:hypothetical protein
MTPFQVSIRCDKTRNVIYVEQSGRADVQDIEGFIAAYRDACRQIKTGFVLVNDQRKLEPYADEALDTVKRLVALCDEYGMSHCIRIVADSLVTKTRISRILVSSKPTYDNLKVNTPEEAEALLRQLGH